MRLSRRISDGLGELCLRYRKTVLLAVAAVSAFTLGQVIDVRFDNAIEIWFVDKDPALVALAVRMLPREVVADCRRRANPGSGDAAPNHEKE